jgi:hypothetical protein
MTYFGSTNIANTGAAGTALFAIKTALQSAGWTVVSSGTGTGGTFDFSDQINTATGTALGSFRVANAWVRMREPGAGTREYILQNGSTNSSANAIIKYSRATQFGTNNNSATVAPTTGGGDGIVFHGTGTDASPVQASLISSASAGYLHAVASDTPVNGVYGWWYIWYLTASPQFTYVLGTEAVSAGSTPVTDADPSVRYNGSGTQISTTSTTSGVGLFSWWEAYGLAGATYRTGGYVAPYYYYNIGLPTGEFATFPGGFTSLDPYSGKVPMLPLLVGKSGLMPKGFTTELLCFGTTQNGVDTFNLSTASPKIVISIQSQCPLAAPWVTSVVPLV